MECNHCGTLIDGTSGTCISCFRKATSRCPNCVNARGKLKLEFKGHRKGGEYRHPDYCNVCKNERFVTNFEAKK